MENTYMKKKLWIYGVLQLWNRNEMTTSRLSPLYPERGILK